MTSEAESEVQRIRLSVIRTEEERQIMEHKSRYTHYLLFIIDFTEKIKSLETLMEQIILVWQNENIICIRETEMLVTRMVEEAERRQSEAESLRREVAQVSRRRRACARRSHR